jgi:hypothetical protein
VNPPHLFVGPWELASWGGWFCREQRQLNWGKRLRAAGKSMPKKLRLRNLRSVNVFLDVDFWVPRIRRLAEI